VEGDDVQSSKMVKESEEQGSLLDEDVAGSQTGGSQDSEVEKEGTVCTEDGTDMNVPVCTEYFYRNREDEPIAGIGWWEDLECGASDTFVSSESMEAATAAAVVVCRAVDAVVKNSREGWISLQQLAVTDEVQVANNKESIVLNQEAYDTGGGEVEGKSSDADIDALAVTFAANESSERLSNTGVTDASDINLGPETKTSHEVKAETETETNTLIRNVFCCIRPPGHHAGRFGNTRGCSQNGFCLLNNAAIGAMYARVKYGLRRIAIIDIDAHFGNGTAEVLEGDPNAFYASVHMHFERPRYFFPSSQCCTLGADRYSSNCVLVNVFPPTRSFYPFVRSKTRRGRAGFRSAISDKILPALKAFKPDILIISAGFDGASSDPVGGHLGLRTDDFLWVTELLRQAASDLCGGRLVSVLEGGYDVDFASDGLANCVESHIMGLAGLKVIP